mmetsp:Transcript_116919/g.355734  ORF Transcript_116919/g.355734 Transcript_116919/m.355734 type:complete len:262 (+) Transcript_116919:1157-1942(+)
MTIGVVRLSCMKVPLLAFTAKVKAPETSGPCAGFCGGTTFFGFQGVEGGAGMFVAASSGIIWCADSHGFTPSVGLLHGLGGAGVGPRPGKCGGAGKCGLGGFGCGSLCPPEPLLLDFGFGIPLPPRAPSMPPPPFFAVELSSSRLSMPVSRSTSGRHLFSHVVQASATSEGAQGWSPRSWCAWRQTPVGSFARQRAASSNSDFGSMSLRNWRHSSWIPEASAPATAQARSTFTSADPTIAIGGAMGSLCGTVRRPFAMQLP